MTHDPILEQRVAEARYHRQRYDLYRAKMYGLRATSQTRLRELQRACEAAETRLATVAATREPDFESRRAEPSST